MAVNQNHRLQKIINVLILVLVCVSLTGCIAAGVAPLAAMIGTDTGPKLTFDEKIKDQSFISSIRSSADFVIFPVQSLTGGIDSVSFSNIESSIADRLEANGIPTTIENKYGAATSMSASQRTINYSKACSGAKTAVVGLRSIEMEDAGMAAQMVGFLTKHAKMTIDVYACPTKQLFSTGIDVSFGAGRVEGLATNTGKGIADMFISIRKS